MNFSSIQLMIIKMNIISYAIIVQLKTEAYFHYITALISYFFKYNKTQLIQKFSHIFEVRHFRN